MQCRLRHPSQTVKFLRQVMSVSLSQKTTFCDRHWHRLLLNVRYSVLHRIPIKQTSVKFVKLGSCEWAWEFKASYLKAKDACSSHTGWRIACIFRVSVRKHGVNVCRLGLCNQEWEFLCDKWFFCDVCGLSCPPPCFDPRYLYLLPSASTGARLNL